MTSNHESLMALLSKEPQISSFILENLKPFNLPHEYPVIVPGDLQKFQKLLEFLDILGLLEHTGDWDPFLKITFISGESIETESGYWSFEICSDGLDGKHYIEIENAGDTLRYSVASIQSIEILA